MLCKQRARVRFPSGPPIALAPESAAATSGSPRLVRVQGTSWYLGNRWPRDRMGVSSNGRMGLSQSSDAGSNPAASTKLDHKLPDTPSIKGVWGGGLRRLYAKTCENCASEFWVPAHVYDKHHCCGRACRGLLARTRVSVACVVCGVLVDRTPSRLKLSKSGKYLCSIACKTLASRMDGSGIPEVWPRQYGQEGQASYRDRALRSHGAVCAQCGYESHVSMLDVDHIDNDRRNNTLQNLCVLCVWCHALKTRKVEFHSRQS